MLDRLCGEDRFFGLTIQTAARALGILLIVGECLYAIAVFGFDHIEFFIWYNRGFDYTDLITFSLFSLATLTAVGIFLVGNSRRNRHLYWPLLIYMLVFPPVLTNARVPVFLPVREIVLYSRMDIVLFAYLYGLFLVDYRNVKREEEERSQGRYLNADLRLGGDEKPMQAKTELV